MVRTLALAGAVALLAAGGVLGYVAVVAARRSEGVFLPVGYVAAICLLGAGALVRVALTTRM